MTLSHRTTTTTTTTTHNKHITVLYIIFIIYYIGNYPLIVAVDNNDIQKEQQNEEEESSIRNEDNNNIQKDNEVRMNTLDRNFIVYPPNQTRTTKSPSPFFYWFDKPITNALNAAHFWFLCMKKIERDADPKNLEKDRLDWPLTKVEKQFCYQLEHRLLFEKRARRSIENIILEEQYGSINNNNNDKNKRRDLAHTEENYSENKDDESVIMKTKNITRLHVYPRFGETLPTHSEFFYQYSSNAIPIIFEELGKRMVQEDTLLKQCLNIKSKDSSRNSDDDSVLPSPLPPISLPKHCPAFLKAIYKIPDFMSIDLYQSNVFRNEDGEYMDERLNNYWPVAYQKLKKGTIQPLKMTTLGSHNVLLVLEGKVEIKLYRKEHHPYLIPKYNSNSNVTEQNSIYDEDVTYDVLPRFQDHDETQEVGSDTVVMDDSIPCYQDILVKHESIYIPSGYLYTFKVLSDDDALILSHEFLDASSLNVHKEETRNKLLKLGWEQHDVDGSSLINETDTKQFIRYYNALIKLHTESVSIQQFHGRSMMSWDIYKSFPRPEPPQPKNRREKYKLWQAKKKWQQNLLRYTGPSPKQITIGRVVQEKVEVAVQLHDKLPKKYFKEVVAGFQITGFSTSDFLSTHAFPKNMKEEMEMRRNFMQEQQEQQGQEWEKEEKVSTHPKIFRTRYIMKSNKNLLQDLGNNTFKLTINNLIPNQMYALRFTVFTNASIGEISKAIIFKTLPYTNPQQLDPPTLCKNNTHSILSGLTVQNCIIVKVPKEDPQSLLPIERVAVKWERVDGVYPFMYEPILFEINNEQLGTAGTAEKYHFVKLYLENKVPGAKYVYHVAAYNSKGGYSKYSLGSKVLNTAMRNKTTHQLPATVFGRRHAFKKTYGFVNTRGFRLGPSCVIRAEKQMLTMSINYIEEDDDNIEAYRNMLHTGYPEHHVQLWRSHFSPIYDIFGELVVGDPISGEIPFFNSDAIKGRIVIVKRGIVPFITKVRNAMSAGALGIIIADNWRCAEEDDEWMHSQKCIVGSVFDHGDGWAQHDNPQVWAQAGIPSYFMTTMRGKNLTKIVERWQKHQGIGMEYM